MPFISIIHSSVELGVLYKSAFKPVYTLSASLILCAGWLTQASIWLSCTMPPDSQGTGLCFQTKLVSGITSDNPKFVNQRVHDALLSFGWVLSATYMALIVLVCIKVHRARMTRKYPERVGMKRLRDGESGEGGK